MSLKLGNTPIAGISQNKICNAHFLFEPIWSDHIINDISLLRADTFSWQSGDVYVTAYNHLVQDIQGITAETETIGSYTVTFYRATDGHKICLADQESAVLNIYNSTGIAWYYILDTTNTQFKLPRTKYGFEGLRTNVGDNINESLPNIKGTARFGDTNNGSALLNNVTGAIYTYQSSSKWAVGAQNPATNNWNIGIDASRSSSTYQDNAPVQERATQMYLYFYVGDYSQSAVEQTAGINSELFNGKADNNLANTTAKLSDGFLDKLMPDYANGITISALPYTAPSNGLIYLESPGGGYCFIKINNIYVGMTAGGGNASGMTYFLSKGDVITILAGSSQTTYFYPLKGAN